MLNYFPQNTNNLFHVSAHPDHLTIRCLPFKVYLHKRFTKSSLGTGNYIMKKDSYFFLAETRTLIHHTYNVIFIIRASNFIII